jgi:hypothetical protein
VQRSGNVGSKATRKLAPGRIVGFSDSNESYHPAHQSFQDFPSAGVDNPPAIVGIEYVLGGPVGSAAEGNSPPSTFEPYSAYFVTAAGYQCLDTLYIQVFSYPLPPTGLVLR